MKRTHFQFITLVSEQSNCMQLQVSINLDRPIRFKRIFREKYRFPKFELEVQRQDLSIRLDTTINLYSYLVQLLASGYQLVSSVNLS